MLNLLLIKALAIMLIRRTKKSFGLEVTAIRNFNYAVNYAIESIALLEDFAMDEARPKLVTDVVGRPHGPGDGVKHGPLALKVVEVHGGTSRDNSVVVIGVELRAFDAHAASEGAANVI